MTTKEKWISEKEQVISVNSDIKSELKNIQRLGTIVEVD